MSGSLDPRIILGFKPTDLNPNMADTFQAARSAVAIRQANQQQAQLNALRGVLGQPGAFDANNNLTPGTMAKVMAVDPMTGMDLRQNMLKQQEHQLRDQVLRGSIFQQQGTVANQVLMEAVQAKDDAAKRGLSQQQQDDIFQRTYATGVARSKDDPIFGSGDVQRWFGPVSYDEAKSRLSNYDVYRKNLREQAQDQRAQDLTDIEKARLLQGDKRLEKGEWVPMLDTGRKDEAGNPTAYRYNATTAQATTLTGQPYTPSSAAAKISTPSKQAQEGTPTADNKTIDAQIRKDHPDLTESDIVLKRKQLLSEAGKPVLSDASADFAAQAVLAGNTEATRGLARSSQAIIKVDNAMAKIAKERGITPQEFNRKVAEWHQMLAAETSYGRQWFTLERNAFEVQYTLPLARDASKHVDRTKYPTINSIETAIKQGTGDENVVRLNQQVNSLVELYARMLNPTGVGSDTSRAEARKVITARYNEGQFNAMLDQINREAQTLRAGLGAAGEELGQRTEGKGTPIEPPRPLDDGQADVDNRIEQQTTPPPAEPAPPVSAPAVVPPAAAAPAPTAAPAKPPVPPSLANKAAELGWSPKTRRWYDKGGNAYDENGVPIAK